MNWQTILKKKKRHPALVRAGVSGFSKPKRIKHKTKSHIVVVKDGDKVKTIRFGQKGVKTNQTAGQRKHLSLDTLRILNVEKCLPLIGLIKLNGVQVRLKKKIIKIGERGHNYEVVEFS